MSDWKRGLMACLCLLLLATPAGADDEDLAELVQGVKDYRTKFRVIARGAAALPLLMEQIQSEDAWLAFESKSAVRWIVTHAKGDAPQAEAVGSALQPFAKADQPERVGVFLAELYGDLATERAVSALSVLLQGETGTAAAAARALGRVGSKTAIAKLLDAAGSAFQEKPAERRAVLEVLAAHRCLDALELFARDARTGGETGIRALGRVGPPKSAGILGELAQGGSKPAQAALVDLALRSASHAPLRRAWALADDALRAQILYRIVAERPAAFSDELRAVIESALDTPAFVVAGQRAALAMTPRMRPQEASRYVGRILVEAKDEGVIAHALGLVGSASEPIDATLIDRFLASDNERLRRSAIAALGGLPGATVTARLLTMLDQEGEVPVKRLIVRLLRERGAPEAVEPLLGLARAADGPLTRDAGHALLAMAGAADREQARDTYLELVGSGFTREAVAGLGRTGDAGVLDVLRQLLDEKRATLHDCIASATTRIAGRLHAQEARADAVKAYRLAYDAGAAVVTELRLLGDVVEIRARGGRVSAWWVIGGFPAEGMETWTRHELKPGAVDLKARVKVGDATLSWRPIEAGGADGIVDLDGRLKPNDNVTAYAYAEIVVKRERDAVLRCGSDDGIYVWLNGKAVHAKAEARGLTVDEDTVPVHLVQGVNRLLVKVCEITGGWAFHVRLEDEKGRPLKFLIR